MLGTGSSDPARGNLSPVGHEFPELPVILVVDVRGSLLAKLAWLLAFELPLFLLLQILRQG
jgi:hypothetical protein